MTAKTVSAEHYALAADAANRKERNELRTKLRKDAEKTVLRTHVEEVVRTYLVLCEEKGIEPDREYDDPEEWTPFSEPA